MKAQTLGASFKSTFERDIKRICLFYELSYSQIKALIAPLSKHFEKYWEMVFTENGFELITAGEGKVFANEIAQTALQGGLDEKTAELFLKCASTFPESVVGIKLAFSTRKKLAPTLYVRTKTYLKDVIQFLKSNLPQSEFAGLERILSPNNILYGLGFSEQKRSLCVKTYTIGEVTSSDGEIIRGFISYRISSDALLKEHKTYLPKSDVLKFETENSKLTKTLHFLSETMNYNGAGHIGALYKNDVISEYKIYLELVGGIPTDYMAR
jgi:hypothetical protein